MVKKDYEYHSVEPIFLPAERVSGEFMKRFFFAVILIE